MSSYHKEQSTGRDVQSVESMNLPDSVTCSLQDLAISAKEGLLALSITVGLEVFKQIMEDKVREIVGPKGKHNSDRTADRQGYEEDASVVLGGQKIAAERSKVHTVMRRSCCLSPIRCFRMMIF